MTPKVSEVYERAMMDQPDAPQPWQDEFRLVLMPYLLADLEVAGVNPMTAMLRLVESICRDDQSIIQRVVSIPDSAGHEAVCRAACFIGQIAILCNGGEATVGEVGDYFWHVCDGTINISCSQEHFLGWFDAADRDEMRVGLLGELLLAILVTSPESEWYQAEAKNPWRTEITEPGAGLYTERYHRPRSPQHVGAV